MKAHALLAMLLCMIIATEARNNIHIPSGWQPIASEHSLAPMTLTFALRQQNLDILEETFWAVSTPKSSQYRQFLSPAEVSALVAPAPNVVSRVSEWLTSAGIPDAQISLNPSGDFLIARGIPSSVVNKLFDCTLQLYSHPDTPKIAQVCASGYSVPSEIDNIVDFVSGLSYFPRFKHREIVRPRESTDSPIIVKVFPGDENFSLFYAPVCSDGSVVTNTGLVCSNGNTISSSLVTGTQFGVEHYYTIDAMICMNCTSWPSALQSYCLDTNDAYMLPSSTMYCHTGNVLWNLENYIPVDVTLSMNYNDNTASSPASLTTYLGEFVTPRTLRDYYGITEEQAICKSPTNSQSVAEFLGQNYSPTDLQQFFQITGIRFPGSVELVGPNNVTFPGIEASLDIQYIMGIAQNVTTYFWNFENLHDGQEPFLEWIIQVLNSQNPPLVHSVSYGDDEYSLTPEYMNRCNTEFQKAGSMGLTILVSSGDNGVNAADPSAPDCQTAMSFTPGFPASSPYVTTVGGTQFSTRSEPICSQISQYGTPLTCNTVGEICASTATGARITSGGGFSNVFEMPSYQQEVVANYLNSPSVQNIPTSYYNASGRAYPDISACARNFLVVYAGEIHPTDGTSAAAPTAAAMMTLINDQLLVNHQSLGFINPTLYTLSPTNFNDIILGDNSCGESSCCPYGFQTTFGWDAATGFGTPNFQTLLNSMIQVAAQQ